MPQIVTPAYAIETGTYTLAPWQTITAEGVKLNTPPGKELDDPKIYNGHGRIFGPDGQNLVPHPSTDFEGLLFVDVRIAYLVPSRIPRLTQRFRSTSTSATCPSPLLTS